MLLGRSLSHRPWQPIPPNAHRRHSTIGGSLSMRFFDVLLCLIGLFFHTLPSCFAFVKPFFAFFLFAFLFILFPGLYKVLPCCPRCRLLVSCVLPLPAFSVLFSFCLPFIPHTYFYSGFPCVPPLFSCSFFPMIDKVAFIFCLYSLGGFYELFNSFVYRS